MAIPDRMSRWLALFLVAGVTACDDPIASSSADPAAAASVVPTCLGSSRKTDDLLACVTIDAVRQHQANLQAIADANSGNRVAGGTGYDASVQYVAGLLGAAGYNVTLQPFTFTGFVQTGPSVLQRTSAPPTTYIENADFNLFSFTAAGDVTGTLLPPRV